MSCINKSENVVSDNTKKTLVHVIVGDDSEVLAIAHGPMQAFERLLHPVHGGGIVKAVGVQLKARRLLPSGGGASGGDVG